MKANLKMKTLAAAMTVAATVLAVPAQAASGTDTTAPYSVANRVNFQIVIPGFLYFRVGPVGGTESTMVFNVPAANVGDGTVINPTGGDATAASVNVEVRGNDGQVTIATSVSSASGLGTGTASDGFISFGDISTTASNASLQAPVLANSGITNTTPVLGCDVACPGVGKVTRRAGTWAYAYANTATPSAGTYTGFATYTASMP